jgi:hypothetical protein
VWGDIRPIYCEHLAKHVQGVRILRHYVGRVPVHTENEKCVYALVLGFFDSEIQPILLWNENDG